MIVAVPAARFVFVWHNETQKGYFNVSNVEGKTTKKSILPKADKNIQKSPGKSFAKAL